MMRAKFAPTTRDMVRIALNEARGRGDSVVGTDHLLVALLHDPPLASGVLGGRTPDDARSALRARDAAALRSAGVDVDPWDIPRAPAIADQSRLPMSAGLQQVLQAARHVATEHGCRRIQTHDLLAAVATRPAPDPALDLFNALGLEPARIAAELTA
ncbi:hypothetical protein EK0264_04405 [Epidermidibacterium keratini]|uniref:Clp R domain-containing protein n=1 Tax=Epidermidibacterium keratini TaxID=1891644 RepID=A0A7L4YK09_9ACTN|nr:Clp protease N-terminal domain-containing protein [Epidermidibacterium keratini]QHB99600.1 hypothetical protein EK0264_04405 [Epidermidibacterium keratini]